MSKSRKMHPTDDIDLATLGAALWWAKGWILGLAIGAGLVTFIGLSMMRPLYTSEARILVQNEESAFTRPTSEQGREAMRSTLDEQAVQSQVQVLTSRDLILQVVRDLDLIDNPVFARDAGQTLLGRLLSRVGLGLGTPESKEERAANALADHLDVFQLSKSSVIAVEYTSGDPELAAKIANQLADVYIGWQRTAKIDQTKDATAWLDEQIKALRKATASSEEAVEKFKASEGLYAGSNNVTLNAQQLSELNSQLILASAQESEARARAKLIQQMLADNGDINATPEVLKSQLIINLIEQRVEVQRRLAELSATLLSSHPRIQQLKSELADVRAQIRDEAKKVIQSLENEAQMAAAREASLRTSLNTAKSQSAGLGNSEIKLRALEREAKANRDLLESYMARYRDASARHDMGAVPAQAAIVSRAHASVLPSFPKKGPLTALVMAATALLAFASTLAKELIGGETRAPVSRAQEPRVRQRQRRQPTQPPRYEPAAQQCGSSIPSSKLRPASPPPSPAPVPPEPAVAVVPPARKLPVVIPEPVPAKTAQAKPEPKPEPRQAPQLPTPSEPQVATAPASTQEEPPSTPPSWQAEKPAKRPSWLQVKTPRRPQTAPETEISTWSAATAAKQLQPDPAAEDTAAEPEPELELVQTAAAAGLLNRLLKEFSGGPSEPTSRPPEKAPRQKVGFLDRFRRLSTEPNASDVAFKPPMKGVEMASLSPNDLRHYLTQRIATSELDEAGGKISKSKTFASKISKAGKGASVPVLKSLDAVLDKVLAAATGGVPRALLVTGTSPKADATHVAINLARALVDQNEQVVLVDLAKGASAVSGPLGMPRVPGFADLAAGHASFSDVIRVDDESSMQVIPAGNPTTRGTEPEPDCFMRVFEALTQAYGCVVLHADRDAIEALMPALKFEFPVMVAVLPSRASVDSQDEALSTFQVLGCPVIVYEGSGKQRRSGLFGRIAAV